MASYKDSIAVHPATAKEVEANLISPDVGMLILTWIIFFSLLGVLYKFAWKPILAALDEREKSIRKSIEDVDRIKSEMAQIEQTRKQLIDDAHAKSKEIIDHSRSAAREAAHAIEAKAKEGTKISLENALRDIREEAQKARMKLREESALIAVELAGKLIEENLNTEKNQKIVNRFIRDI